LFYTRKIPKDRLSSHRSQLQNSEELISCTLLLNSLHFLTARKAKDDEPIEVSADLLAEINRPKEEPKKPITIIKKTTDRPRVQLTGKAAEREAERQKEREKREKEREERAAIRAKEREAAAKKRAGE